MIFEKIALKKGEIFMAIIFDSEKKKFELEKSKIQDGKSCAFVVWIEQ